MVFIVLISVLFSPVLRGSLFLKMAVFAAVMGPTSTRERLRKRKAQ